MCQGLQCAGSSTIEINNGRWLLWADGATHTWIGKTGAYGFVFDSDQDDPLEFRIDGERGYVYEKGKGRVTMPEGETIGLPPTPWSPPATAAIPKT